MALFDYLTIEGEGYDCLRAIVYYQNEIQEIKSILKKVEGWSV